MLSNLIPTTVSQTEVTNLILEDEETEVHRAEVSWPQLLR